MLDAEPRDRDQAASCPPGGRAGLQPWRYRGPVATANPASRGEGYLPPRPRHPLRVLPRGAAAHHHPSATDQRVLTALRARVTVPETVKLKGRSSASSLAKERVP